MSKQSQRKMDASVFGLALERLGVARSGRGTKSYEGARLVLVEGNGVRKAAKMVGVEPQAIYQAIERVESAFSELGICPYCGQRLPHV